MNNIQRKRPMREDVTHTFKEKMIEEGEKDVPFCSTLKEQVENRSKFHLFNKYQ